MKDHHLKKLTTTIILFIFFFLLFFIPFSLYIISRNHRLVSVTPSTIRIPTPTVTPRQRTEVQTVILLPVTATPPLTAIPVIISQTEDPQTRLLEIIQNRPPLSTTDISAKNRIVRLLPAGQYSGIVYKAIDFTVDYVADPDIFQVEVTIPDTEKAKQEALDWFSQEGMSLHGICNLPIEFYLNTSIKNQISNPDAFNPLPAGC